MSDPAELVVNRATLYPSLAGCNELYGSARTVAICHGWLTKLTVSSQPAPEVGSMND